MTPKEISRNIANNLKHLRKGKGVTQEQLISEIGDYNLSLRSYVTYESGEGDMPSLEKLVLLADYFNCSIDYLIRGVDNTPDNSFMLTDNLKRLSFLIFSLCLIPIEGDGTSECKYKFISLDKEMELFIDKLMALSKDVNYLFDYQGKKIGYLMNKYIEISKSFKEYDEDQKPSLERFNRQFVLNGENPNEVMKKRLLEQSIRQKKK